MCRILGHISAKLRKKVHFDQKKKHKKHFSKKKEHDDEKKAQKIGPYGPELIWHFAI